MKIGKSEYTWYNITYITILKIKEIISNNFSGILNVIPLQLMAYHIAKNRGLSVDTPANHDGGQSSESDSMLNSPEK